MRWSPASRIRQLGQNTLEVDGLAGRFPNANVAMRAAVQRALCFVDVECDRHHGSCALLTVALLNLRLLHGFTLGVRPVRHRSEVVHPCRRRPEAAKGSRRVRPTIDSCALRRHGFRWVKGPTAALHACDQPPVEAKSNTNVKVLNAMCATIAGRSRSRFHASTPKPSPATASGANSIAER